MHALGGALGGGGRDGARDEERDGLGDRRISRADLATEVICYRC